MANSKSYSYQIKGNKISLLQDQYVNDGASNAYGPDGKPSWTSPNETVQDGIEIEYAYSPNYRINDLGDVQGNFTGYGEATGTGLLKFTGTGLSVDTAITHIVIKGSGKWNGLHKINTLNVNYWIVETKYNGVDVAESDITAYTDISTLADESSEIDLPNYLSLALVYYIKGKLAEDAGQLDVKEYNMREFRVMVEKHESSKIAGGSRRVMGFGF